MDYNNEKILTNKCSNKTKLQPIQKKLTKYFQPSIEQKGILLFHKVGSGKTCSAISMASNFEDPGYSILWVTKRTLLKVIEQNLFGKDICHPKINPEKLGSTYQQRFGHFNKVTNKAWLTPISYRSFSNLYKKKSSIYKKLVQRNGEKDPLRKTLIIIDEGHNLFSEDPSGLSGQEKAKFDFVQNMIQHSYKTSGKDSARLIVLSATPSLNGLNGMFQLINTMIEDPKEHLPLDINKITPELKQNIEKISEKYISYYDGSTNPELFAQKNYLKILSQVSKECKSNRCKDIGVNQINTLKKCNKLKQKNEKIECIEKLILWNDKIREYNHKNKDFNPEILLKRLPHISTNIDAMIKNIETLDKLDKIKYKKTFKHVIYIEKPKYVSLLLNVLIAKEYNIALDILKKTQSTGRVINSLDIELKEYPKNKDKNIALFTQARINGKNIGKNLIKKQRDLFNNRENKTIFEKEFKKSKPSTLDDEKKIDKKYYFDLQNKKQEEEIKQKIIQSNVYGENVRFAIIDRNFLEGVSFFDVKYLHILTLPDSEDEMEQLIGRVVRFCGHTGLPFKKDVGWNINIITYENYQKNLNITHSLNNLKSKTQEKEQSIIKTILESIKDVEHKSLEL